MVVEEGLENKKKVRIWIRTLELGRVSIES